MKFQLFFPSAPLKPNSQARKIAVTCKPLFHQGRGLSKNKIARLDFENKCGVHRFCSDTPAFAACKDSGNTPTGTTAGEKNTTASNPEITTAKPDDKPTPEKATEIRTSMQLAMVAEALNADSESSRGKTYILKANIDMAGEWTGRFSVSSDGKMSKPCSVTEWKPIAKFYGTFDGNGKTITGLFADGKAADGAAMFGELCDGAVVKNLTVDRSFFASKGGTVAGLAQTTSGNVRLRTSQSTPISLR